MNFLRSLVAMAAVGSVALTGLVTLGTPAAQAALAEDDLVLLIDGSGSIDATDWQLQLQGFSAALQDRLNFPLDGSVAVSVIQWSSGAPRVEIPLTNLDSRSSLDAVVTSLGSIRQLNGGTNPGDGIRAGTDQLLENGRAGARRSLCLSTDGERNGGESVSSATAYAMANNVEKLTVVAIEDGSFDAPAASRAYGPHVFGGGTVTTARTTAEFTTLISGCIANAPVLEALEMNQSVQDLDNSIPLVAGKGTVVRAYLSTDGDTLRTSGRLRGYRDGVELPGSPLSPLNSSGGIPVDADYLADRRELSSTLNYKLPVSWTNGAVTMSLELPGGVVCGQPEGDTMCSRTVSFQDGMVYRLEYRALTWGEGLDERRVFAADLYEQHLRAASLLPVGDRLRVRLGSLKIGSAPRSLDEANEKLQLADRFRTDPPASDGTGVPEGWDTERWYGVLPGAPDAGNAGGKASGKYAASWLRQDGPQDFVGHGRNRVVHELGHTYGLHHTTNAEQNGGMNVGALGWKNGWCSEQSNAVPEDWPYWRTSIAPDLTQIARPTLSDLSDPRGEAWGLDTRFASRPDSGLALSDPAEVTPLMSYCESYDKTSQMRWISPTDYKHLLGDDLSPIGIVTDHGIHAEGLPGLLVRGIIGLDDSTVDLSPALVIAAAESAHTPQATHELAILDAGGTELHVVGFTPVASEGDPEPGGADGPATALMHVVVPGDLHGAASAEIRVDGAVVSTSLFSAGSPTISVTSPTAASADRLDVSWTSSDTDGDALTHTVLYSVDSGETWELVAADIPGASMSLPRWSLPASERARIKVIVSDGLRSSEAVSPEFSLPNLAPSVTIGSPTDGTTISGAQALTLEASAYDAEDGDMSGTSISWTSNLDGDLGTGQHLLSRADELTEGSHILTATARDSAGATSSASVTVHVERLVDAPDDELPTCEVQFQIHGTSPGAFTAQVTIRNTSPDSVAGWSLAWAFLNGESVGHHWSSDITTGTSDVLAMNLPWNSTISPGDSVTFGFNGVVPAGVRPTAPSTFLLNGSPCS